MPDPITKYLNEYPNYIVAITYDSPEQADSAAGLHRIARIKVQEVERVTFEKEETNE